MRRRLLVFLLLGLLTCNGVAQGLLGAPPSEMPGEKNPAKTPAKQLAKIASSDGSPNDLFGFAVAVSGNTVVVGAPEAHGGTGAAYVFVKPPNGWMNMTQTAELTPSDGSRDDFFGSSVAVSGDTVVVGAPYGNNFHGGVYVFVRPKSGWANMTETAKLDDGSQDELGWSVCIDGRVLVTGSEFRNAAYLFLEPQGGWKTTSIVNAKLTSSDTVNNDYFGFSVAIAGKEVAVGSPYATFNGGPGPGAVYVYRKPPGGWKTTTAYDAKLTASDGKPLDYFGSSVSVGAATVAVGARYATIGSHRAQGAAYVFVAPEGQSTETAKLTAARDTDGSEFGTSIAISRGGRKVLVGAPQFQSAFGVAYTYSEPDTGWETTSNPNARRGDGVAGDLFGEAVALGGGWIVVGAPYVTGANFPGSAYVLFDAQ